MRAQADTSRDCRCRSGSTMLSNRSYIYLDRVRAAQIITVLLLMAFMSVAQAYSYLAEQVQKEFKNDLYPIDNILRGYKRPRFDAPKFAVAEFRVASEDLHIWSQAVAEILRYRMQYVPGAKLYMPAPYYSHVDAGMSTDMDRPLLTATTAFGNLRRSLGIDTVLTGEVISNGDHFVLSIEMIETRSAKVAHQRDWKFESHNLPDVLIDISKWAYQSLDVKLTEAELDYLDDRTTLGYDAIQAFVENYRGINKLEGPLRTDKIRQLHEAYPDFTLLAVYAMHNRPHAQDLDQAYANLDYSGGIRARFAGNAGIELESYRSMEIEGLPKHVVSKRLEGLKRLVSRNPQDPTMAIVLADALTKNGDSFNGLSVLLEAVDRWPEQYRVWWSLGWALNTHAWQVRGNSLWRDVPERAKTQFTRLSDYADQAIDEALTLNPHSPQLWSMKINSMGSKDGFSSELMKTFDKAVKHAPKNRNLYENALNYSAGRWGGNAAARKHIIAAAERNNPDVLWLDSMKRKHVVDLDNWQDRLGTSPVEIFIKEILDHPDGKYLAAIAIFMILFLVFHLGRRSA